MPALTYTTHDLIWEKNGYPVIVTQRVTNASIGMQYEDDDDEAFWCSFGAMKNPYGENTSSPAMETSGPPVKLSKLSISLKKDNKAGKMTPPLKDCSRKIINTVRTILFVI